MKISNSGPGNLAGAGAAANASSANGAKEVSKNSRSAAAEALGASVGNSAKVDVSSRAQEMNRAKELATPSASVDEAKVARLQALIDSGQYKIDAAAIADKLVDEQMKMNE
jgi:negative regulator of flagellin synthesis FlgM